jgi:uncharacterized repeat protein (TIGR03803 family)
VLHKFGAEGDGFNPYSGLIDVNGTLYGTTANGGSQYNDGTLFLITPSGIETVLHSFGGGSDGIRPTGALTNLNSNPSWNNV